MADMDQFDNNARKEIILRIQQNIHSMSSTAAANRLRLHQLKTETEKLTISVREANSTIAEKKAELDAALKEYGWTLADIDEI